jgi:putative ABC transport system permease protein
MDYRSQTRTLAGLAAYANWSASLASDDMTERLQGARITANALYVLGVTAAAGRVLNDDDDRLDGPLVAMISYRVWQQRYGGDPGVVGRNVRINGESFVIVGVLPVQFPLPLRGIDVVTPLAPERDPLRQVRNSVNFLRVFGRLEDGADISQAAAELTSIGAALRQQYPVEYARKQRVEVLPLHEALVGEHRRPMLMLLAAVIVVLATAVANLVALALVRANGRRGELAVRVAMGASQPQLFRQLTIEALVLTLAGSGIGWMLAVQAIGFVPVWAPPTLPRLDEIRIDAAVSGFALAATLVVTLLLAVAPFAVAARTQAGDALRAVSRGAVGDRWNSRVRNALVVAEISAALVLTLATIALLQNLRALQDVETGFNAAGVFQARLSIPTSYRSSDDVSRFYDWLLDRLANAPGVSSVGVTSVAPLTGLLATIPFSVATESTAERERTSANVRTISPGYLATVGTRLLRGRPFTESDRADTPPVALVSAALADRMLSSSGVGQRLLINDNNDGPRPVEVVGVVENVRQTALDVAPTFDIYLPLRQVHRDGVSFVRNNQFWMVKTASDPASFRGTFLSHVRAIDPDAAVSGTGAMRQFVDESLGPRRFSLVLFASFAVTAIVLAVSGLYGLVAYAVSQRASEIGLRMAIGATHGDVHRMVLRQAAALAIAGSLVGLLVAIAARPLMRGMVQDAPIDLTVVIVTAASLMAVVLLAAWVPARRAARIDPTAALKAN